MPKIYRTNSRKAKELSAVARECFEKIVGLSPSIYTPEEVKYTFTLLLGMVQRYLKDVSQAEFDSLKKHDEIGQETGK